MTGPVDVAIGVLDDKVVLRFEHALEYIELDAVNALDISEAIAALAFKLRNGVEPAGPALKASLVERHHDKLVPRVALMLASMRDQGKSDGYAAEQIVTSMLAEVF